MKKLLALLLALAVSFSLAIPAFAANTALDGIEYDGYTVLSNCSDDRHAPFLLLGFMFQLIARHLLHTLNIIVVESFTTPHHYCPMSVQPPSALTVTERRCYLWYNGFVKSLMTP